MACQVHILDCIYDFKAWVLQHATEYCMLLSGQAVALVNGPAFAMLAAYDRSAQNKVVALVMLQIIRKFFTPK